MIPAPLPHPEAGLFLWKTQERQEERKGRKGRKGMRGK